MDVWPVSMDCPLNLGIPQKQRARHALWALEVIGREHGSFVALLTALALFDRVISTKTSKQISSSAVALDMAVAVFAALTLVDDIDVEYPDLYLSGDETIMHGLQAARWEFYELLDWDLRVRLSQGCFYCGYDTLMAVALSGWLHYQFSDAVPWMEHVHANEKAVLRHCEALLRSIRPSYCYRLLETR